MIVDLEVWVVLVQVIVELLDFVEYLLRIVLVLMEDKDLVFFQLKIIIFEKSIFENIKKFFGDLQIFVLLIQRFLMKGKYVFYYFLNFFYFF